jgi:Rrf2 family protein
VLTQTSELAIKTLIFLAVQGQEKPLSPRRIALSMDCSPSYLAKTVGHLVRTGVLRSVRGSAGGVLLARTPQEISLLDVVEACQGLITAQYCEGAGETTNLCSFHRAMAELHEAVVGTLTDWTLEDLLHCPASPTAPDHECKMLFSGCEDYCQTGVDLKRQKQKAH